MSWLLINTCGDEAVVALAREAGVVAEERMAGRTASERLLAAVRRVMDAAGALAGVGVVVGPGSFTGVRVGLSAAKGICEGRGVGIVGISRLALLRREGPSAVLDAGRGEYFCLGTGKEQLVPGENLPAGALVTCEARVREKLGERVRLVAEPGGEQIVREVLARVAAGGWSDVETLDASYLRRTDAEIAVERR